MKEVQYIVYREVTFIYPDFRLITKEDAYATLIQLLGSNSLIKTGR